MKVGLRTVSLTGRAWAFGFFTASRTALSGTRWRDRSDERGVPPRRSRPASHEQRRREGAEEISLRASGGEGEANAARGLDHAGGDFQQPQAQRRELGLRQIARVRDRVANAEHQPIGGGVQDEANLIGARRAARGSIGGKLRLVQLDEVFRLSARAIEAVIEPLRGAVREIGEDKADVSSVMASVAVRSKRKGLVSATESYAISALYATLANLRTAPS